MSAARCYHGDPLLDELESLRFSADRKRFVSLCVQATTIRLFPLLPGAQAPMMLVDKYGARWFEYRQPRRCPNCNTDLRAAGGPPLKREIAIYDRDLDRTVAYRCPDCLHEWSR